MKCDNYGVFYKIVCYFCAVHVIPSPSLSATQTTAAFVHITSKTLQKTALVLFFEFNDII